MTLTYVIQNRPVQLLFCHFLVYFVTLRENGFSQILKPLAVILKCLALNNLLKASTAGAMPGDSASL